MQRRYIKTPAGRHEALVHHRELPRALRNLLLVINDSQPVDYWLSNVKGVAQTDVDKLLAEGLIAEAQGCLHPEQWQASQAGAEATPPQEWDEAVAAIAHASATQLSQTLKALAWPLLRGTRAYQFVQEVDAETPEELRQAARAFAGLVRGELGLGAVHQLRVTLTGEQALPSKTSVLPLPKLDRPAPEAKPAAPAAEDGADVAQGFRLRRWPAAQALIQPGFARLASLLSTRTLTLQQLAILGRVEAAVCLRFLQEMRQLGLLDTRDSAEAGLVLASSTSGTSVAMMAATRPPIRAGVNTPRVMSGSAPPVSFGLLGRLRERLGLR